MSNYNTHPTPMVELNSTDRSEKWEKKRQGTLNARTDYWPYVRSPRFIRRLREGTNDCLLLFNAQRGTRNAIMAHLLPTAVNPFRDM